MWTDVQRDLVEILSSRLFPSLASDPGYIAMLRNAGLTSIPDIKAFYNAQKNWAIRIAMEDPPNLRSSIKELPPALKSQLKVAAQMCVTLMFRDKDLNDAMRSGALRELRAKATVLKGKEYHYLYRLWDSEKQNVMRHWWFSEHLLELAQAKAAITKKPVHEWLRDRLAISLNFSKCDEISRLKLGPSTALPAIEVWGNPMPCDLEDKNSGTLYGHKTQYYLPFLPPDRIQ